MTWPPPDDPTQRAWAPPPPPGQWGPPQQQQPPQPGSWGQPPGQPPPPPMPYAGAPYGPSASGPKRSRKGLIIALSAVGVVVVIAVVAIVVLYFTLENTAIATDMKVGDCISEVPTGAEVVTLPTIDCAQPHAGEVFAVLDMPSGDYPGASTISDWQNKCPDELSKFAPSAVTDNSVGVYVLYPTADTWSKGDRAITCIATLDPKRSGSIKG